jgi:hypothetical protein
MRSPVPPTPRSRRCAALVVCLVLAACAALVLPAGAAPPSPSFGVGIDPLARYDGQSTCDPTAKPGVVAFYNMLKAAYPSTGSLGIVRDCGAGDTSEHKEGRALDWAVNAGSAADVAIVNDVMTWLLAPGDNGEPFARVRRLGIMYMIFNHQIWGAYSSDQGWRPYDGANPHTDHVHFSFSWAGAMKQTTWYTGSWMAAADGTVYSVAAPLYGSVPKPNRPIVGIAGTPRGDGYWLVGSDGGIFSFGKAAFQGSTGAIALNQPIVGMAPTPTGDGYWMVASDGGIFAFGDAAFFGSTGDMRLNRPIVGMAPTPSGRGYWLVASDGGIFAYGDAAFLGSTGSIALNRPIVGMTSTPSGKGYWMTASDGGMFAYGDAGFFGSTGSMKLAQPVVSMYPSAAGLGYVLVAADGGEFTFGDGLFRGSAAGRVATRIVGATRYAKTLLPPVTPPTVLPTTTTRPTTTTTRLTTSTTRG